MTDTWEQPAPALPPEHPAAAYYPAAPDAPEPPANLTALGVLAFTSAAILTVLVCANALVVGRVIELGGDSAVAYSPDWSVAIYYLTSLMTYAAMAAAWVTGAMWLHRARRNAEVLAPDHRHARRAGWAWGGWLAPVVLLWFPYQVVRDVDAAVSRRSAKDLVACWWGVWLATLVGWRVSEVVVSRAMDRGTGAPAAETLAVLVGVVTVVGLTFWGMVLQRVTTEQHALMYGVRAAEPVTARPATA